MILYVNKMHPNTTKCLEILLEMDIISKEIIKTGTCKYKDVVNTELDELVGILDNMFVKLDDFKHVSMVLSMKDSGSSEYTFLTKNIILRKTLHKIKFKQNTKMLIFIIDELFPSWCDVSKVPSSFIFSSFGLIWNSDPYENGVGTLQIDIIPEYNMIPMKINLEKSQMAEFYKESILTDVTIICTDGEIQAHKVVLALWSPVLMIKFTGKWDSSLCDLSHYSFKIVKSLIDLIYYQDLDILSGHTLQEMIDIFIISNMLFPKATDIIANELTRFDEKYYLGELLELYPHKHLEKYNY